MVHNKPEINSIRRTPLCGVKLHLRAKVNAPQIKVTDLKYENSFDSSVALAARAMSGGNMMTRAAITSQTTLVKGSMYPVQEYDIFGVLSNSLALDHP